VATYDEVYRRSVTDPEGFWREAAAEIDWVRAPDRVIDRSRPPFTSWFPDGVLNTSTAMSTRAGATSSPSCTTHR
jgi:propionyl-CoA synthetase